MKRLASRAISVAAVLAILTALAPAASANTSATPAPQPRLAAATSLTLTCTQTSSSRASSRRRVDGAVDTAGHPSNITVTRVATGNIDIFSASPQLVATYSGGYFKRTYGLDAWLLGTVNVGYPPATYYLLLPPSVSTGVAFAAQLHIQYANGTQGWNQFILSCTAS
jgi:hypothetical protein